ncbi:MAG: metal-dependent transcriptional regulator [Acholeplasmataceae bacterium]|nr:metal-dependent transcriptional regulator [Acholeplasmataceae bacterium]
MKKLTQSCETYLMTIYQLQEFKGKVRSVDIAKTLGYARASVCNAIKNLMREELITMDAKKNIYLTTHGKNQASELQRKYLLIKKYLMVVWGMDEQAAARDVSRTIHIKC